MSTWDDHVLPHGPLTSISARVWTVQGSLPRGKLPRTMVVHRLDGGGLWIHSAVALDEATLRQLLAIGEPRVLVVPNAYHRLDAGVWKQRFPKLRVLCPAAAREKVAQKVAVDGACEDALPALGVGVQRVPGIKPGELCYELPAGAAAGDGRVLVVTDMMFNLPHQSGFGGWIIKTIGSSGFFGMTLIGRLLLLSDRAAFCGWLESQARRQDLVAVCVGHGDAVSGDVGPALAAAAARLRRR